MLSPDELMELMGKAAYDFEAANREIRRIEQDKQMREAKTSIIVSSKRWDMIQNASLKQHFKACCEDPKFRPTVDFIDYATYVEHQDVFDKYNAAVTKAKQAKDEFDMWQKQLSWYQSKNKLEGLELMALGGTK